MSITEEHIMGQFLSDRPDHQLFEKTIDDLPDDALYVIFENLENTELIKTVSLVCRRWHDLAFNYPVWVHRHVKATEIGGQLTLLKILTDIPVIHTLDLTRTTVQLTTMETILRSSIKIRNLKLYDCSIEPEALLSVNLVLNHLSINLESLSIEVQNDFLRTNTEFNLKKMVSLRRLTLIGDLYLDGDLEEFDLECPEVLSLDLSRFNTRTYNYSDPRRYAFTSNLISETKRKLQELHLPFHCNNTMMGSVTTCQFLTTISLQLEYLAVVSFLPLIETLKINCESSAHPPVTWTRPKNLKELVLHLRRPKLASIDFLKNIETRSLTLISDNLCTELEQFCSDSINRLTLRCHFLRLRHLTITISREAKMPNLKYLDVRNCFLGRGIPPRILSDLKRRNPDLVVRSDRFVGYQTDRNLRDDVACVLQESTDCSDTE